MNVFSCIIIFLMVSPRMFVGLNETNSPFRFLQYVLFKTIKILNPLT